MSDRLIELRLENRRLKEQVANLEEKVLALVGAITIQSSGVFQDKKHVLNDKLVDLINSTDVQLNIVSPKIDQFYTTEIKKIAQKGLPCLIITNDRGGIPTEYQPYYDDLKSTDGIKLINNPNVRYLLVFNTKGAIYSGGSLDRAELERSILIATTIEARSKLKTIAEIFSLMLGITSNQLEI